MAIIVMNTVFWDVKITNCIQGSAVSVFSLYPDHHFYQTTWYCVPEGCIFHNWKGTCYVVLYRIPSGILCSFL